MSVGQYKLWVSPLHVTEVRQRLLTIAVQYAGLEDMGVRAPFPDSSGRSFSLVGVASQRLRYDTLSDLVNVGA